MDKIRIIVIFIFFTPICCLAQHTKEEKEFIKEINLARTNPKAYLEIIKSHLAFTSQEEKEIVEKELVPLLNSMKPLPALKISEELYKEAIKHPVDSAKIFIQHDLTFSWLNIPYKDLSENISYGTDIRENVVLLLIDCSSASRGHRLNILNPNFTHTSVRKINLGNYNCRADLIMGRAKVIWLQNFIEF
jgi:uncharacterized protein YkwD